MNVSLQYAEDHLTELISAADRGEEVEITRPEKPTLKLVISNAPSPAEVRSLDAAPSLRSSGLRLGSPTRKRLLGAGKGEIWLSDDWDSAETNKEIEDLFESSVIFPQPSTE